jgi:uracil-DNA glycosylase family 4
MGLTSDQIDSLLGLGLQTAQEGESKATGARCWECPLKDSKYVPSSLPPHAEVALVSRSPGRNDTTAPFTGPSQPIVDHLLERNGFSRKNVVLTNVVLCQTDNPSPKAIEACRPRLLDEVKGCSTIIAGGTEAVQSFTKYRSVQAARGFVIKGLRGERIIAANNPALVLRDSDTFPTLITDFKLALDPLPNPEFPKVEIINDPDVAKDRLLSSYIGYRGNISTDLEWNGTSIYCAGFSRDGRRATVFGRGALADTEVFGLIKRFYESDEVSACWHNGKSDTSVLWRNDIRGRVDNDTFLLSYALDEEPGRHSLDYLLQTELGWPDYEPESVKHFKKTGRLDYYGDSPEATQRSEFELYEYNGWDAAGTQQLFDILVQRAKDDDVYERPYRSILQPAANAFRTIELRGFRFDAEGSANVMEAYVLPKLNELTKQMQEVSHSALLNPRSTQQMAALYYDVWGLKHTLRNKAKVSYTRSTGKEVREEIQGGRFSCRPEYTDVITKFSTLHRTFAKIERQRGNYFQSLIEWVDENGYIHPWFNIGGTVSGRTSATKPNFQNITRSGVEGIPSVRELFLPSPGNVLISCDYSQAELRTMAQLSGDSQLVGIYMDNKRSLHKERAAAFYGTNYTYEEYVRSKNINFGVSYGQAADAFAQMYHMDKREAQAYIDAWWREFPQLKLWTKAIQILARTGEIVSPLGYKRRFHLITKDNLANVEREAVNFVPQNSAGGFTILAIIELVEAGVPIVNTVHDSIIADVPTGDATRIARLMKSVMESIPGKYLGWQLPFTVDVSIGTNWAQVKEIEL